MSKQKYCELVDQLCAKLGIEDPTSKYDDCNLQVNDVAFTLMHGDEVDPDGLVLYADFGKPPARLKARIYVRLMETTFLMYGYNTPSFAFNMETEHVVQMMRLPSSKWELEPLIAAMGSIAGYAQMWRENYFLTDEERGQASESGPRSGPATEAR